MALQAVLWDMDGTLVDTEPYWIECEFALAARYEPDWSHEHALNLVGRDLLDSARYIKETLQITDLSPAQIRDELLAGVIDRISEAIPWRPGARELLQEVQSAGLPNALVTMSYRNFVQPVVEALPTNTFAAVVTGDEVDRGKPHPDPYLRACDLLGVDPGRTVAIEDSPTGCRSAEAAGCRVLAVPNHVEIPAFAGRVFRNSLSEVKLVDLEAMQQ